VSEWAWAAEKGSNAEVVAGKRVVVGASTTESAGGRLGKRGVADRRGLQISEGERQTGSQMMTGRSHRGASESGHERGRFGIDRSAPLSSERERGKSERTREGADRRRPPVREGWCAGARARARMAGLTWAKMAFSFFRDFLNTFLFIFSRVFNSNSNQYSNSNQFQHVQQFKEYFKLSMMQHFMTHIVLTK
jgi:hypothetical protein